MKILIIPDVHQTKTWRKALEYYINQVDYIIQVGDWFDTHDEKFDWEKEDPIQNFNEACEFSRLNEKFKICLGNHDFSYLLSSHCSQFQFKHYGEIKRVLLKNLQTTNIAYECDEWIISHAGFTKTWMKNNNFETIEQVNKALHDENFEIFQFCGIDFYGDDITQGPTWVRPTSLYQDAYFKYQVVGHTPVKESPLILDCSEKYKDFKPSIEGQKIICIDDDFHDKLLLLDTEEDKE